MPWGQRLRGWAKEVIFLIVGLAVMIPVVGWLRAPELPAEAPGFLLEDLSGETVSLEAYRGQTVVLNFWATWCGPCRAEIPTLNRFAEAHPEIPVLAIAEDGQARHLEAFAKRYEMTYPVLRATPQVLRSYKVKAYPTTVIVGPDGQVEKIHTGVVYGPYLRWLTGTLW